MGGKKKKGREGRESGGGGGYGGKQIGQRDRLIRF